MREQSQAALSAMEARGKGEGHRNPYNKDKEGENQVRGRPPVPTGMTQGPIGRRPIAGIIDQYHGRDGNAAEEVKSNQTPGWVRGLFDLGHCHGRLWR